MKMFGNDYVKQHDTVVPLIFLGISSLLNIVFDILFVAVIPMGVGGAAFATVLAQVISGVACLLYAWKILPMLRIRREKLKLDIYIGKQMQAKYLINIF